MSNKSNNSRQTIQIFQINKIMIPIIAVGLSGPNDLIYLIYLTAFI